MKCWEIRNEWKQKLLGAIQHLDNLCRYTVNVDTRRSKSLVFSLHPHPHLPRRLLHHLDWLPQVEAA
jgi:hypothetical protein